MGMKKLPPMYTAMVILVLCCLMCVSSTESLHGLRVLQETKAVLNSHATTQGPVSIFLRDKHSLPALLRRSCPRAAPLAPSPPPALPLPRLRHAAQLPPPGPLLRGRRIRNDAAAPGNKTGLLGSAATQKEAASGCARGISHHQLGREQEGATRLRSGARGQLLRHARCNASFCASIAATALETPARARSRRAAQGQELHLDQTIYKTVSEITWSSLEVSRGSRVRKRGPLQGVE